LVAVQFDFVIYLNHHQSMLTLIPMAKKLNKKQKPKLNEDINEIAFRVVQQSANEDKQRKSPKKLKSGT
jgi:hypothetical protein